MYQYYESKDAYIFTADDLSYTVIVHENNPRNIEVGSLIKHSESQYTPVSADNIQLAASAYYQELETKANSELIADELEGIFSLFQPLDVSEQHRDTWAGHYRLNIKLNFDSYWMYCTSIDPLKDTLRKEQAEYLDLKYDCMAKIEDPSEFAMQIGLDFAEQIDFCNDLKVISNSISQDAVQRIKKDIENNFDRVGEHIIFVRHGPIIYTDTTGLSLSSVPLEQLRAGIEYDVDRKVIQQIAHIAPFLKLPKYQKQQEYRFIVWDLSYMPNNRRFYLKISNELRNLVSPITSDLDFTF